MPNVDSRALTYQQQLALEIIAEQSGLMAADLLQQTSQAATVDRAHAMADAYGTLLLGAMFAIATTRLGYLQALSTSEGMSAFDIPSQVIEPTVHDVLVGPHAPEIPAARGVGSGLPQLRQYASRTPSPEGGMWAALARLEKNLQLDKASAMQIARDDLVECTESTAMATADYVDRMVLGPDRRIVALRRVAHPTACDRCMAASTVLIFKENPRPRHPQCRCSFEPVFIGDSDYTERLKKYAANAQDMTPGRLGIDRRNRGRTQQEEAKFREESVWLQDEWTEFLRDEQTRLARLVRTVPSTQYRDWAVMTSANQAEIGGDLLPVLTRQ